jgi:hypothetical protein
MSDKKVAEEKLFPVELAGWISADFPPPPLFYALAFPPDNTFWYLENCKIYFERTAE